MIVYKVTHFLKANKHIYNNTHAHSRIFLNFIWLQREIIIITKTFLLIIYCYYFHKKFK